MKESYPWYEDNGRKSHHPAQHVHPAWEHIPAVEGQGLVLHDRTNKADLTEREGGGG